MSDRTAFPWVPKTTWKQITPKGWNKCVWEVTITDPSENPPFLRAVRVRSTVPTEAINIARDNVWWWLDWDGRRIRFVREEWTELAPPAAPPTDS